MLKHLLLGLCFGIAFGTSYGLQQLQAGAAPPPPPPPGGHCIKCSGDWCVASNDGAVECTLYPPGGPRCEEWGLCFPR